MEEGEEQISPHRVNELVSPQSLQQPLGLALLALLPSCTASSPRAPLSLRRLRDRASTVGGKPENVQPRWRFSGPDRAPGGSAVTACLCRIGSGGFLGAESG